MSQNPNESVGAGILVFILLAFENKGISYVAEVALPHAGD